MSAGRAWTPEEESLLRESYPETPMEELSAILGRNPTSIQCKVWRMKLRRSHTPREG